MLYKEFLRRFQPTPRRDVVTINMADIPGMSLGDFGGLLNAIFQAGRSDRDASRHPGELRSFPEPPSDRGRSHEAARQGLRERPVLSQGH